jgi:gluconate 2-dehydrogenase gamma chain
MTDKKDDGAPRDISRRGVFRQVGAAGVAALAGAPLAVAPGSVAAQERAAPERAAAAAAAAPQREALETLTAAEADTLEAIVARLIPADENGPGAAEARAAHYIDRALVGPLRGSREAYANGLAALDTYAQSSKGAPFARLSTADQDAVLTDLENNVATGFLPNSSAFFALVRTHTIQGTFCDPYYGGNANFIGWDMIGYPGLRMAVGEDEQRMTAPSPLRRSAYDEAMFTLTGGAKGGDHGHRP